MIALLAVMILSALYAGCLLRVGWVPSDEGTLAQSAMRVYQGQLPQRDFTEIYTGGLSFIHAAAFHLFGVNLLSLRIAACFFFVIWVAAVYYMARRMLAPLGAALVTLTAVSWSYPNYPAAMPSWYNLFFASFGAAALLRYIDVRTRRWLFVAGVCGGASILIKIIGVYYVAAVLMFLLFVEQSNSLFTLPRKACGVYRVVCSALLGLYLVLLTGVVWPEIWDGAIYNFLLPSALCVALLLWRERKPSARSSMERFSRLFALVIPFLLGVVIVIALYLIPYVASHSVALLIHGVMGSASARMVGLAGRQHAPSIGDACYGLVTLALILFALYSMRAQKKIAAVLIALGLTAVLGCSIFLQGLQDTWLMAGTFTPLAVLLGVAMIVAGPRWGSGAEHARQRIMLLIALAAMCSLVQYPVPYVTYFCYAAPFVLLATVAAVASRSYVPGKNILSVLLVFFLAFGIFAMVAKHIYAPELRVSRLQPLILPRAGGLMIDPTTTPRYDEVVPFLQAHSPNGLLYAGNDCPELYFLSGLKNPTRDDTGAPLADVLAALRSGELQLVALNDESFFQSGAASPELRNAVVSALPHTTKIGRFSIYWR
ncbi:MAG TPA: glycosyltransferase family 39 protein [Acidobacteriaceae bacterium]